MVRCNHPGLLVIRTTDCVCERAVCLFCDGDVPEWKSISHVGRSFYYRYISVEDFEKGVVPRITAVS